MLVIRLFDDAETANVFVLLLKSKYASSTSRIFWGVPTPYHIANFFLHLCNENDVHAPNEADLDEMDMNKEGQVCLEEWNEMKSKVEDDDVHRFKNKVCKSGVYIFSCPV